MCHTEAPDSVTNQAVQPLTMEKKLEILELLIKEVILCSKNKGSCQPARLSQPFICVCKKSSCFANVKSRCSEDKAPVMVKIVSTKKGETPNILP